jgi:hypothetical protein
MIKDISKNPSEATSMTEEEINQARMEVSKNMAAIPAFMKITIFAVPRFD